MERRTLAEYIQRRRWDLGLTQRQLAKAADDPVSAGYIAQVERGAIARPGPAHLAALARGLGVAEKDLLRAMGHAVDAPPADGVGRQLSPEHLPVYRVPTAAQLVPAGGPSPSRAEGLSITRQPGERWYAVQVTGDCMAPTILPGEWVVIDPDGDPRERDVCVLLVDGEPILKRLVRRNGEWELHADNPAYGRVTLRAAEVDVQGVVVEVVAYKGKP